jgi:hypothetical protein
MDWNELPLDPRHLGVPSGAPKMISEPIACSAQTIHLSCIWINIISKENKMSFHLTHVTKDFHHLPTTIFEPMVYLSQSLSRTEINTIYKMDRNNIPLDPHHLGIPSGVPKAISEPIVHSVQTVHQSCMQINTISKRPKRAFIWLTSPRSSIRGAQKDFRAYFMLGAKRAPILCVD